MKGDGGPAFPRVAHGSMTYEDLGSVGADPQTGMTLRDYFAAAALTGETSSEAGVPITEAAQNTVALRCYEMADAMLKARGS